MKYEVTPVETVEFRGDRITNGRFSGENFDHHRYFSRELSECEFRECRFDDLRMWDTLVAETLFDRCDLRSCALGGIFDGRANRFHNVTFRKTDLRRTAWSSAEFVNCRFEDCRYGPVDFQGSRFIRCTFVGEIYDALFYERGFQEDTQPPNEMAECDFSQARLKLCGFRRLDLLTMKGPSPDHTYAVCNYRRFLEAALREAKEGEEVFRGMIEHQLKWAGPRQVTGYFDHDELSAWLGANWKERIAEIERSAQQVPLTRR